MTCKNIVLHLGMDKTGSTSIRASLARHLADPAFHFVQPGMRNSSRCLAAAYKDDPTRFQYFRRAGLSAAAIPQERQAALEALAAEIEKASGRTAIVSAEAVSTFSGAECRRLRDGLLALGSALQVVGYVRRPKAYMESNFQQQIKAGTVDRLQPLSLLPDYRRRFEPIDEAFGRERVTLWLFEPKDFPHADVTMHFCGELGIQFEPAASVRTNESLSRAAIALLFVYRSVSKTSISSAARVRANDLLVRRLVRLKGPRLRLHSSMVAKAIAAKQEGIDWMAARLGASMAEDLSANDDVAVRSEEDLMAVPDIGLRWLGRELGPEYASAWRPGMPADEVAGWMGLLQDRLTEAAKRSPA